MRLACLLVPLWLSAFAHAETALRVMGFGGGSNWPLFVAQERGFFRDAGLEVRFERAPDSATQMRRLVAGDVDIAMTAMDNVVAQREGDVIALLGVNGGARLRLFGTRAIASVRALAGRDIAVDAVDTGYAFVLRRMLAEAGLEPRDYRLVSVGGSRERWNALREERVAAALLNSPYDARAEREGLPMLAHSGSIGAYQGSVGAARRAWAEAHREAAVAFVRAYVAALHWLLEPGHREEAMAILMRRQSGLGASEAGRAYDEIGGTFTRDGALDAAGVAAVIDLRRRFGPPAPLRPAESYYDLAYLRAALSTPAPGR